MDQRDFLDEIIAERGPSFEQQVAYALMWRDAQRTSEAEPPPPSE